MESFLFVSQQLWSDGLSLVCCECRVQNADCSQTIGIRILRTMSCTISTATRRLPDSPFIYKVLFKSPVPLSVRAVISSNVLNMC